MTPVRARTPAPGFQAGPVLQPLKPGDRGAVEGVLRVAAVFREDEIAVALEVLDSCLAAPGQDYSAVGAFTPGGNLLGFAIFGPTPCTLGTWDLYWIAVGPRAQGKGVGTALLKEVERRLSQSDARQLLIETSSRPQYDSTRAFYRSRGFEEVARIPDFYENGDDNVVYAKKLDVRPADV